MQTQEEKIQKSKSEPVWWAKKPTLIQAMKFDGSNTKECCQFIGRENIGSCSPGECIEIFTLEGSMRASVGDFIIKGLKGEFYPCKPDIFVILHE